MKRHTVKVLKTSNGGWPTLVSVTIKDETEFLEVKRSKKTKKLNVVKGEAIIGTLKKQRLRWYDNQYLIEFIK